MNSGTGFEDALQRLKAAAEPTRLRLLAACTEGELTVSELCLVVQQSQPRVSRHLKLLCEAGLLIRFREGHCVYYRAPIQGSGAVAVSQLLSWIDPADRVLERDRRRRATVRSERGAFTDQHSRTGSSLQAESAKRDILREVLLKEATNDAVVGDLLDIGTGTGRILKWLGPQARSAVGIDISPEALRVARAAVRSDGLSHCLLQLGDMYELPFPAQSFDTVTMDRVLGEARLPAAVLEEAARQLRPSGRLFLIEDYDRLESKAASAASTNGLQLLRKWVNAAGLECERLRPVETGQEHLIVAVGRPRAPLSAAA